MPRTGIHNRLGNLKQENPMNVNHYIGFDVHKKSISYCVKTADGTMVEESTLRATHLALREWAQKRREPWHGAMEATLFSGWIYDTLKPYAAELQMGHAAMMKAIGASKKKNDKLDARKTADLVRCNLVASMLRGAGGNPRAAADAALPQSSGGAGDAHEEQDERAAHGGGSRVQPTASAREGILPRIVGHHRRSAGIGKGSVAPESRSAGDVSDDAVAIAGSAAETAATSQARDGAEEHSRSGRSDGSHLGAGSGRPAAIPLGGGCGELLRADFGVGL